MIIGLDVGGTNIDAVLIDNNAVINVVKKPTGNLNISILEVIKDLTKDVDKKLITKINLSTTISTNLIATNQLERVVTIIQNGLGLPNSHYQINEDTFFIKGYIDHRGQVLTNYEDFELKEIRRYLEKHQINNIAINTKFAVKNNKVEKDIKNYFNGYSVSIGSELTANLNLKRRVSTSYLNQAIINPFNKFYNDILNGFKNFKLTNNINILKACGGLNKFREIKQTPVESIASGPAASLLGHLALFDLDSNKTYLNLDIGGTTTDLFISIGDNYLFEEKGLEINNYKTAIRSIYFRSIPIGGDTAILINEDNFYFSNKREGLPLALGGPYLTITDCLIYLDNLDIGNKSLSIDGLNEYSSKLNINDNELAKKIINEYINIINNYLNIELKKINSKPLYTVKEVIDGSKIKIDEINIIGGPAKSIKPYFNVALKLDVNYPNAYLYANALGAALAKESKVLTLYADTELLYYQISELNIKKSINRNFNLTDAISILKEHLGNEMDIILKQEFNMVDGFYTKGKIIKVIAQLKPGIIYKVGDFNEET